MGENYREKGVYQTERPLDIHVFVTELCTIQVACLYRTFVELEGYAAYFWDVQNLRATKSGAVQQLDEAPPVQISKNRKSTPPPTPCFGPVLAQPRRIPARLGREKGGFSGFFGVLGVFTKNPLFSKKTSNFRKKPEKTPRKPPSSSSWKPPFFGFFRLFSLFSEISRNSRNFPKNLVTGMHPYRASKWRWGDA